MQRLSEHYKIHEETLRGNDFDGFELRSATPPQSHAAPFANGDSDLHFTWSRVGRMFSAPAWSMSLELILPGCARRGYLMIYKRYASDALRVDINLLLQEFRVVLAYALGRALSAETEEQTVRAETLAAAANSSLQ